MDRTGLNVCGCREQRGRNPFTGHTLTKVFATIQLCAGATLCGVSTWAFAATPVYPSKPIRLVVPFPPGGGSDNTARIIAERLGTSFGKQVVIDNRSGGGGIIGTEAVANANPDGYTLLWGTGSGMVINPLLNSKLSYDVTRDLAAAGMISVNSIVLTVYNALPANSVKELVALARAKPNALSYASAGYGSPVHLAMELFKATTGTDIAHIPYKGASAALVDVMGGQVHMKFNNVSTALPLYKAGKLKVLGIGDAQRSRIVPEVPTMIEAGVPGFEAVTWYGIFVPAKTPSTIVGALNTRLVKMLSEPELTRRLAADGSEPRATTPEGLTAYMREESERWKRVIKRVPPPT